MLDDRRKAFYDRHFEVSTVRYKPFDEVAARLTVELTLTCDMISQTVARYMGEFGLSKSTFNILMLLRSGPTEGMPLHQLGQLLLVSRANVTGLINHLEEMGHVTREVSLSDRRVRYARITQKAEALLDLLTPLHFANLKKLLIGLPGADKQALRALLKRVRDGVVEHAPGLRPMEASS